MRKSVYVLSSNFTSLVISALAVLVVPRFLSLEDYGHWQFYIFISSYVGLLHLGWNDGIYLRYGGSHYAGLDRGLFFSQFLMLAWFQGGVALVLGSASTFFTHDANRIVLLQAVAACLLLTNVRLMLLVVLQATGRVEEYARIVILDRVLYACLMVTLIRGGIVDYRLFVAVDLVAKACSLCVAIYVCRELVVQRVGSFRFNMRETAQNIRAGSKLMFATLAGMLIVGVVRFGIERTWDVATFGKVSLILNVSSFMMVFVNAMAIVAFPFLRRADPSRFSIIYSSTKNVLMPALLGVLILYYPMSVVLSAWLPAYADSLKYMSLVFPMVLFEGKMALLVNTFLKTLRKEKLMLAVNLFSLVLSMGVTIVTTVLMRDLGLAVLGILVLLALRCLFAEIALSRFVKMTILSDSILELALTALLVLTGWFVGPFLGMVIYLIGLALYLLAKRVDIDSAFTRLRFPG